MVHRRSLFVLESSAAHTHTRRSAFGADDAVGHQSGGGSVEAVGREDRHARVGHPRHAQRSGDSERRRVHVHVAAVGAHLRHQQGGEGTERARLQSARKIHRQALLPGQ